MLNIFKSKYKPIREYPDTWLLGHSGEGDDSILLRLREGLKEAAGHPKYPFKVSIEIPFEQSIKLMGEKETNTLVIIESAICSTLEEKEGAVLVMTLAGIKFKELVFYVNQWNPEFFKKKVNEIAEKYPDYHFQLAIEPDRGWETYKRFAGMKQGG